MAIGYIGAAEQHLQTGSDTALIIWKIQIKRTRRVCYRKGEIIGQRKALAVETGKIPATIAAATIKTVGGLVGGPALSIPKASRSAIIIKCESLEVVDTRPVAVCVERIGDVQSQVSSPIQAHVKGDILKCQRIGPGARRTNQPEREDHDSQQ